MQQGETLEQAVVREVHEETGLERVRIVRKLGDPSDPGGFDPAYFYGSHVFHAAVEQDTPAEWAHEVHGAGEDAGLVFVCRWVPLAPDLILWGKPDPLLSALAR